MVRIRIKDAVTGADEGGMTNRFWIDRPVLVTGATGLLGSWLSRALLARGARVIVIVRDEVPDAALVTSGDIDRCVRVRGDVEDGRLVERVLVEHEVDAVFHLAAQTIVEHAVRDPLGTLRANVAGTWELLDACRRSGRPARIVVASSDKAYGTQPVLPYTEDHAARGPASVRRFQELRRPDRERLREHVRPAARDHALRQPLRRRRSQLLAARAGHDPPRTARRASGAAQRRLAAARLPARGRCGRCVSRHRRASPRPVGRGRGVERVPASSRRACSR